MMRSNFKSKNLDVLLIPFPSIGSLDIIIPFLLNQFKEHKKLSIGLFIYDLSLFQIFLKSNYLIDQIIILDISIIIFVDGEFFLISNDLLKLDSFKRDIQNQNIDLLSKFKFWLKFLSFYKRLNSISNKYSHIETKICIGDLYNISSRKKFILKNILIGNMYSIRHGITLSPLEIKIPDHKYFNSRRNFESIYYYYYSKAEFEYVSKNEFILDTKFKKVSIPRHTKTWLNSDVYLREAFCVPKFKYIAIFTRPLSDYLFYSDLKNIKKILTRYSLIYSDVNFLIKNHPKDHQKSIYKYIKSFLPKNRVFLFDNISALRLASNSIASITFYSNMSVDFARFRIPSFELYCPSLTRYAGYRGYFIDNDNLPSLDYRAFGLTTALTSHEQLINVSKKNSDYRSELIESQFKSYNSIFL